MRVAEHPQRRPLEVLGLPQDYLFRPDRLVVLPVEVQVSEIAVRVELESEWARALRHSPSASVEESLET